MLYIYVRAIAEECKFLAHAFVFLETRTSDAFALVLFTS